MEEKKSKYLQKFWLQISTGVAKNLENYTLGLHLVFCSSEVRNRLLGPYPWWSKSPFPVISDHFYSIVGTDSPE